MARFLAHGVRRPAALANRIRPQAHSVCAGCSACRALLRRVLVLLVPPAFLPAGLVLAALLLGGGLCLSLLLGRSLHRCGVADLESSLSRFTWWA